MAGSMRNEKYTTDSGAVYVLPCDESNIEATHTDDFKYKASDVATVKHGVPRNIRPRYCIYESTTTEHKRKVPILTPTLFASLKAKTYNNIEQSFTENVAGTVLTFRAGLCVAEKERTMKTIDTGLVGGSSD